jgi:hypothetical protein
MGLWVKPSLDTKLHIDFDWWKEQGSNFRVVLQSRLCDDCREKYAGMSSVGAIDWVNPDTAQITQVDGLWHSLRTCCSHKPNYITEHTPLAESVFRIFLANDNTPLTPTELQRVLGKKTPEAILAALAGKQVYMGIKPVATVKSRPKK